MTNWMHGQDNRNSVHQRLLIVFYEEENFPMLDHAALPSLLNRGVRFLTGKSALMIIHSCCWIVGAFFGQMILCA